MRVLAIIGVILLTTFVNVAAMTAYEVYVDQNKQLVNWEKSFTQLANACGVQYQPQSFEGLQAYAR